MRFIVAISVLIIGFAYVNVVTGGTADRIQNALEQGINEPLNQMKYDNNVKGNLGATANSLTTALKEPFAWLGGTANGLFSGALRAAKGAFNGFRKGGIAGAARGASQGAALGMGEGFSSGANAVLGGTNAAVRA